MKERNELAASAFKVITADVPAGIWFEDVVSGYKTLSSSGRETMEKELTLKATDRADGTVLLRSRFPERTIEIEYFIESDDYTQFQSKFETLMLYANQMDDRSFSMTNRTSLWSERSQRKLAWKRRGSNIPER